MPARREPSRRSFLQTSAASAAHPGHQALRTGRVAHAGRGRGA
jgi:hypothetical protein